MNTARTLVIVTHPNIHTSIINKRWLAALRLHPDLATVNELYARYPNQNIDVRVEQALLLAHDNIILQFPLYWFSTPPLLKKWLDEVLLQGFAYGSQQSERRLAGKRIGLAISAGIKEIDFHPGGRYAHTLDEFVVPLHSTIEHRCGNFADVCVLWRRRRSTDRGCRRKCIAVPAAHQEPLMTIRFKRSFCVRLYYGFLIRFSARFISDWRRR